jgi:molecular chaperone DnaK (HSP70)
LCAQRDHDPCLSHFANTAGADFCVRGGRKMIVLALLLLAGASASDTNTGTFFGLDLGAHSVKIASPKFNTTVDIVLNEQSRRKSPNFVGFRKHNRYVAEEAKSFAPRFPSLMLQAPHLYLGKLAQETESVHQTLFDTAVSVVPHNPRGTPVFKFETYDKGQLVQHTPEQLPSPSAEDLTSMMIAYAARSTQVDVQDTVSGVVIAIPHATLPRARIALKAAVELAGLKHVGFVHSLTAAAFQYGVSRGGFGDETVHVVIVDVGAAQAQAGLFRYDPPKANKTALRHSLGTITTLQTSQDDSAGSAMLDRCVAEIIDAALVREKGSQHAILTSRDPAFVHRDAQRRFTLRRAAEAAKEDLSVSIAVQVTVEAADANGSDFSTMLTRTELDEKCGIPIAAKIAHLVSTVLTDTPQASQGKLFVELVGAGTRVPAIVTAVADVIVPFGGTLGRRLNTDDSVAMGAAYVAAQASGFIKIRGFAINDKPAWSGSVVLHMSAPERLRSRVPRHIFNDCSSMPCRRSVAARLVTAGSGYDVPNAFSIQVALAHHDELQSQTMTVIGGDDAVANAIENTTLAPKDLNMTSRVELHLQEDGLIMAYAASCRVSRPKTKAGGKHTYTDLKVAGTNTASFSQWGFSSVPMPMTEREFNASLAALKSLDVAEAAARNAALKKNDFETFLLDHVDRHRDAPGTPASNALKAASAWLEGKGSRDDCTAEEYEARHALLRAALLHDEL